MSVRLAVTKAEMGVRSALTFFQGASKLSPWSPCQSDELNLGRIDIIQRVSFTKFEKKPSIQKTAHDSWRYPRGIAGALQQGRSVDKWSGASCKKRQGHPGLSLARLIWYTSQNPRWSERCLLRKFRFPSHCQLDALKTPHFWITISVRINEKLSRIYSLSLCCVTSMSVVFIITSPEIWYEHRKYDLGRQQTFSESSKRVLQQYITLTFTPLTVSNTVFYTFDTTRGLHPYRHFTIPKRRLPADLTSYIPISALIKI